jgi:hypothetical protein
MPYAGYQVMDSVIPRCQWLKAREFKLTEVYDCEGDSIWSLGGPDTDLFSYSRLAIDQYLDDLGVDKRFIRFESVPWPGECR